MIKESVYENDFTKTITEKNATARNQSKLLELYVKKVNKLETTVSGLKKNQEILSEKFF